MKKKQAKQVSMITVIYSYKNTGDTAQKALEKYLSLCKNH